MRKNISPPYCCAINRGKGAQASNRHARSRCPCRSRTTTPISARTHTAPVMTTRIAAINVCSPSPCTRPVTFATTALLTWPTCPTTIDEWPSRKVLVINTIHTPVMMASKSGNQRGTQRLHTTNNVTPVSTKKGVRGWLNTTKEKMVNRVRSNASHCTGRTSADAEAGATNQLSYTVRTSAEEPYRRSNQGLSFLGRNGWNHRNTIATMTRYKKKLNPCGEK